MQFAPLVSAEILDRHPDFHLASIVVRDAAVSAPEATELSDAIAACEAAVCADDAVRDAHLAAWAAVYSGFGSKPSKYPSSAAALIKRVRKDAALPRISPLVDAYNAISTRYGIPIGGEDLDRYQGRPQLILADGSEGFEASRGGETVIEHPDRGEIVWRDDEGVTCRRWNWRQGRRTMVTDGSTAVWLVLEALGAMPAERLTEAADELVSLIRTLCPDATVDCDFLDAESMAALR